MATYYRDHEVVSSAGDKVKVRDMDDEHLRKALIVLHRLHDKFVAEAEKLSPTKLILKGPFDTAKVSDESKALEAKIGIVRYQYNIMQREAKFRKKNDVKVASKTEKEIEDVSQQESEVVLWGRETHSSFGHHGQAPEKHRAVVEGEEE